MAAGETKRLVDELHGLGCALPTGQQYLTYLSLATSALIQTLPWARNFDYRHLAPRERISFSELCRGWSNAALPQLEARLGNGVAKQTKQTEPA